MNRFEKAARLARLLVAASIVIGLVPTTALAAAKTAELTIASASVAEGNTGTTQLNLTVSLSKASTNTVTVKYATANGTAKVPGDYTAKPLTTLTFAPGQTSKPVAVAVRGDLLDEAHRSRHSNLR